MRTALALTTTAMIAASPAQADDRSLWDLLHPDRLITQVLQSALFALRTQMDLTYADLTVSLLDGEVALEGIDVTVPADLTDGPPCPVQIGRLDLSTADPFAPEDYAGQIIIRDLSMPFACLGPDAAPVALVIGSDRLNLADLTIDFRYHIPSAALEAEMRTEVSDLAAVELSSAFDYLWFREGGPDDVQPVGRLSHAALSLTNLGGWDKVAPLLPPPATDPDQAAAFVTQLIGGQLSREAGGAPSKAVKAFVADLAEGWSAFVTDPKRLVIESSFPPDAPRAFDADLLAEIEDAPLALIDFLEPRVSTSPAAERNALDPRLVAQAMQADGSLPADILREVGLALLTGDRAPRNRAVAVDLLSPLAEAGDGDVAFAVAQALEGTAPEDAYAQALAAGPFGPPGLRSLLNRLERDLPFATVLRLQGAAAAPTADDLRGPVPELRARAEAHLTGVTAPRSLRSALIYATIAAASGDRAAARLLDRIDRAIPSGGADAWAPLAAEASELALTAWLDR